MVAVEHAIRKWAKDLRLRTRHPKELENLEQILHGAEARLKEIKQRRTTRKRDRDLSYLAETSGHSDSSRMRIETTSRMAETFGMTSARRRTC
jgi:hypothetical protein